jgi:hypothetical protein
MLENLSLISFISVPPQYTSFYRQTWSGLTKRLLEQLTNIHYPLGRALDERRSGHVGESDPAKNKQSKNDRRHTYRHGVITLPGQGRAPTGILLSRRHLTHGFPGKFIKRRIVSLSPISFFRQVYFFAVVISDAGAVLTAPAVSFSIDSTGHKTRIYLVGTNFQ